MPAVDEQDAHPAQLYVLVEEGGTWCVSACARPLCLIRVSRRNPDWASGPTSAADIQQPRAAAARHILHLSLRAHICAGHRLCLLAFRLVRSLIFQARDDSEWNRILDPQKYTKVCRVKTTTCYVLDTAEATYPSSARHLPLSCFIDASMSISRR